MSERSAIDVIVMTGELDVAGKDVLHDRLRIAPTARAVLLDLTDVTYADSTALTELLRFRAEAERQNLPVAIVAASPQFDRIIRYAGLYEVFAIFDDRGEALSYLGRPPA